ncbi:MAG: DUF4258 domain-containing protein [Candidatus Methylomirabilis sp.]|nr:DUF4258 domain-containing protein [Deltaproteobacteria bacterium]
MREDDLDVFDVESAILYGRVLEVQRDRDTGERKYRLRGPSVEEFEIETVVKPTTTGKVVIVTVYAL